MSKLSKLEVMENVASFIGYCSYKFAIHEWVEVIGNDDHFVYYINGTPSKRELVESFLPLNDHGFEDESVLH